MRMAKSLPSQGYLRSKFIFDEEGGWLYWLHDPSRTQRWNSTYAGKAAGTIKIGLGYILVELDGIKYLAHRLIWVYLYGFEPVGIDHKDGDGFNNCPENLREADQSLNLANADFGDARGVERHGKKFRVRIFVNNERINLGSFDTFEEAKEASRQGHSKYFGEFAYCNREQ